MSIREHISKKTKKKRYTATFRKMVKGQSGSESKTFSNRKMAENWLGKKKIEADGVEDFDDLKAQKDIKMTINSLISSYLDKASKVGRSKKFALESMKCHPLLHNVKVGNFSAKHLYDFCKFRNTQCEPQTVWQDVSFLRSIFKQAKTMLKMDLDDSVFREALPALKAQNLISKSKKRNRKATNDEMDKIISYIKSRPKNRKIPTDQIVEFAYESCMRISEVCALKWDNINYDKRLIFIEERKDPSNKHTNDQDVPLTSRALEIIKSQSKNGELIFPYNSKSVSTAFQRARDALGIKNLRLHDLRRTGLTRLINAGLSEFEARQVSGHKDLKSLQIYVDITPEDVAKKMQDL